ncbi:GNAT family N-acetyltransferase [Rhizobium leguminosarum bv. viciae 248]|uniref:GNAT family N-acetyltransferase n=1 Tax=Rhizobium leguminosarum TaxID=384 RepID=UPI000518C614|nr:GNAT family protein [Rhizobium leguminosarum]MCA2406116.1 GNAT family N-acetyltransferase [Rhizobium leguminosarum]QHW27251.1 GNAT family N-acetyltransferase [Rhizobium leguminosarum bv. viciae 248]
MNPPLVKEPPPTITFRDITEEHLPQLFEMRRDLSLQALLLTIPDGLDETTLRAWVERRKSEIGGMFRIIVDTACGEAVGFIQVNSVHRKNRTGYGGICLAARARNRGLGQAALRELIKVAGNELELIKLLSEVRADNFAALRAHLSVGYRLVGTLENHFTDSKGKLYNVLLLERVLGGE